MGHASINTTIKHYAHLAQSFRKEEVKKLEGWMEPVWTPGWLMKKGTCSNMPLSKKMNQLLRRIDNCRLRIDSTKAIYTPMIGIGPVATGPILFGFIICAISQRN
jgi:hypothetical protein